MTMRIATDRSGLVVVVVVDIVHVVLFDGVIEDTVIIHAAFIVAHAADDSAARALPLSLDHCLRMIPEQFPMTFVRMNKE